MIKREFSPNDHCIVEFHDEIHHRIKIDPIYFASGFSPVPKIYGRQAVLNQLLEALDFLPEQYGFLIWDIYRPRAVQEKLFNWMREVLRKKFPGLSEEENYAETKKYMSPPARIGDEYCPPHLSGGAIDLTLYMLSTNKTVEMGTPFDDCTEKAHSNHYELQAQLSPEEIIIKHNRNLLKTAMEHAGFTAYQYEWWHFDLGNIFWSKILNKPAVFGPLFGDQEWPQKL